MATIFSFSLFSPGQSLISLLILSWAEMIRSILAQGGKAEAALVKNFKMIREMQSNEGITLLDKDDTFFSTGYTFAGVYDALQAFAEQIAGATGIPLVRLLGQSPKGFSTGESDLRCYYDTITTLQNDDLRPPLETLFAILSRHLWNEPLPSGFGFDFESLMQPTEADKAQIATADAQASAALVSNGIITAAQALANLRECSRLTGRFANITEEDIEAVQALETAPEVSETGSVNGQS